ncbi:MAG: class I SAM-dependent methyltransferase [Phycisphaerales bacterium]
MSVLGNMANVEDPGSFSNRMRSRRFAKFEGLCKPLARPIRVIDIGGTEEFWRQRGWAGRADVRITLVNLFQEKATSDNIESVVGDATRLSYADKSFDVAFSNSVIEHLFTWENQQAMAREVRRVARAHWVQTPNYWFPMEPHFHVPGWQWMPASLRASMVKRLTVGGRGPYGDSAKAMEAVKEIRLLTGSEMRRLFPESEIWPERLGGLVKSWVAIGGFGE